MGQLHYNQSLQLLTDFYELTMAKAHWDVGTMRKEGVFTLHFRSLPFGGGYAVAAGLAWIIEILEGWGFSESDLEYLADQTTRSGDALFPREFLDELKQSRFECTVEAVPEGTVVFPHEPLIKVTGPIWQCQLIESMLLNQFNFQTLIATKAARICHAAGGAPVVEFGLRRAQGIDGAVAACRAAFIGGVESTSNVFAGKLLGIPVRGTLAHSWIMSFPSEREAFEKFVSSMPDSSTLLVDTFDSIRGIANAVAVGKLLRERGKMLAGIRLDSGDLAYLSQQARAMLDEAGFTQAKVVATHELNEYLIESLRHQNAKIDVWGVGTHLITAYDQPALNGIYKLSAVRESTGWDYKIKISDQISKTSNPGNHRLRRFYNQDGTIEGDLIYDISEDPTRCDAIVDPTNPFRRKKIDPEWESVDLLRTIFDRGKLVHTPPSLREIQAYAAFQLKTLHPGHRRLAHPHEYPVGLSPALSEMKLALLKRHTGTV